MSVVRSMKNSVQEDRFLYMSEMFFINSTKERVRCQLKSLHYDLLLSCFLKKQVLPYVIKMRKCLRLFVGFSTFLIFFWRKSLGKF